MDEDENKIFIEKYIQFRFSNSLSLSETKRVEINK